MVYAVMDTVNLALLAVTESDPGKPASGTVAFKLIEPYGSRLLKDVERWRYNLYTPYAAIMSPAHVLQWRAVLSMVPVGGKIVEVGSYCGGSAKIALEMISPDTSYTCIDAGWYHDKKGMDCNTPVPFLLDSHWSEHIQLNHDVIKHGSRYEFALQYLSGYQNVQLIPGFSPRDVSWWQDPIDLYFEDGDHTNPTLRNNLDFWVPHVRSGGIIAGHDYNNADCPDVNTEAQALARTLGTELHHGDVPGSVWWMRKP
jgi:hypothetical protein